MYLLIDVTHACRRLLKLSRVVGCRRRRYMDMLITSSGSPLNHDNVGRVSVISRCLLMNGLRNALKISVVNFHCVC